MTRVDPVEARLPLLDRMYKEYENGKAPEVLERLAGLYRAADAFVIVTGEYNHSVPPALMNLLDHFLEEYFFRPSAIVCYSGGQFGGVRAAVQLRASLCEMGMPSISSIFPVPSIGKAFDESGAPVDAAFTRRFERFVLRDAVAVQRLGDPRDRKDARDARRAQFRQQRPQLHRGPHAAVRAGRIADDGRGPEKILFEKVIEEVGERRRDAVVVFAADDDERVD